MGGIVSQAQLFGDAPRAPPPSSAWQRNSPAQAPEAPARAPVIAQGSDAERLAFAEGVLRYGDPIRAAREAVEGEARVWAVASTWPSCPRIKELKRSLLAEYGEEAFLPSRAELARTVYDLGVKTSYEPDTALKAFKLYAEIMGHISKPAIVNNVTSNVQRNVMVVENYGTDAQWEASLKEHQAKLIADVG